MTATRDDLFARFADLNIHTETRTHDPVYTVEQARALRGEIPGGHCKNLFLKDKKGALWLIVCLEDAQIDLKSLPQKIGSARISFGKADLLMEVLGVEPGSVTPFALINDADNRTNVILDADLMSNEIVNFHPLENTATTSIRSADLITFIESCGHKPQVLDIN